jgi:hypothetical protein
MTTLFTNVQTIQCQLAQHAFETRSPLPHTNDYIYIAELGGAIVDLTTGEEFVQHTDWLDFAIRWADERARNRLPATWNRLSVAIHRATHEQMIIGNCIIIAQFCLRIIADTRSIRCNPS